MPETIRSFIAFDIDNPQVLKKLADAQDVLAKTGADLTLVKPQNIHITIRFLGDITLSMAEKIDKEMQTVAFKPFDIEIKGVGAFPNLKYARVIWAGIQQGEEELKNIFNQLEPRLRILGFRPDPKGFSAHLTIARVKSGRNKAQLAESVTSMAGFEFGKIQACCLKLKKSVLTPQGPIYSTLKEARATQ
ncbi:MAG: RNA 2',3'-cyclic phosphodiesterase [Candidatus Bathyarchaeales archaeon]